jgi:hypothetical protein
MLTFIAWCLLLLFSWPLALLALLLWPVVWLVTLPLRIAGFAVEGVLGLLRGLFMLPARLLGARSR